MQLQFSLCLNIERQWGWSCFYYYYFLCGIKSTSVMACELFQHSLCKIRVWQGVSIDRSVVEIEQTWINKGQNCQQEECPVACEDLLLNSIRKARSCPRAEPKAPEQTSNFLRIFTIDTYLKKKLTFLTHHFFSLSLNAQKHIRFQSDLSCWSEGNGSFKSVLAEHGPPCAPVKE